VEIKCQLDATDEFYCRSYCLINMFRAPLCPSSGARDYYTCGCCLWYLVLWFSSCRYSVELRVVCPVCGLLLNFHILRTGDADWRLYAYKQFKYPVPNVLTIYVWVFPMVSFPQVSPPEPCVHLSPPPYALHAPPISFFSIVPPAQYWVRSTDH
jgi:hypothetical protein